MQCKFAPAVTRPCATKQGSPVHDLHHAHRVQFIPCKMMPFATFAEPSSSWHITSLPTRPLGPDLHRTTRELAGGRDGIHPVETVISRIASPLPRTATIARASHSSLAPSPADRSWACHSSVSEMRPSWGSTPPLPPSSPPTTEAHTACPQPRHVRSRHLLLPSESSSLEEYVYHSCNLWDAPGEEVSGRSQVRTTQSNPLYRPVPLHTILCGNFPMSIVNRIISDIKPHELQKKHHPCEGVNGCSLPSSSQHPWST